MARRDPRPGDLMRMSRSKVEQVKLDLRRSARDHAMGLPAMAEEVIPLYGRNGWPVAGKLSMTDMALVVAVPMRNGVICLVLTQAGRLLSLRNAQFDNNSVEFIGSE